MSFKDFIKEKILEETEKLETMNNDEFSDTEEINTVQKVIEQLEEMDYEYDDWKNNHNY